MALSFRSTDPMVYPYVSLIEAMHVYLTVSERDIYGAIEKLSTTIKPDRRRKLLEDVLRLLHMTFTNHPDDKLARAAAIRAAETTKAVIAAKMQDAADVYYNAKQVVGSLVYAYMVVELMLNTLVNEYLKELHKEYSSPISVTN